MQCSMVSMASARRFANGGATGAFGDVLNQRGDADRPGKIGADEDDAVSDGRRLEGEGGFDACKQAVTRDAGVRGDRFCGAVRVTGWACSRGMAVLEASGWTRHYARMRSP